MDSGIRCGAGGVKMLYELRRGELMAGLLRPVASWRLHRTRRPTMRGCSSSPVDVSQKELTLRERWLRTHERGTGGSLSGDRVAGQLVSTQYGPKVPSRLPPPSHVPLPKLTILVSGTLRGYRTCAPTLHKGLVEPNLPQVALHVTTYDLNDCGGGQVAERLGGKPLPVGLDAIDSFRWARQESWSLPRRLQRPKNHADARDHARDAGVASATNVTTSLHLEPYPQSAGEGAAVSQAASRLRNIPAVSTCTVTTSKGSTFASSTSASHSALGVAWRGVFAASVFPAPCGISSPPQPIPNRAPLSSPHLALIQLCPNPNRTHPIAPHLAPSIPNSNPIQSRPPYATPPHSIYTAYPSVSETLQLQLIQNVSGPIPCHLPPCTAFSYDVTESSSATLCHAPSAL